MQRSLRVRQDEQLKLPIEGLRRPNNTPADTVMMLSKIQILAKGHVPEGAHTPGRVQNDLAVEAGDSPDMTGAEVIGAGAAGLHACVIEETCTVIPETKESVAFVPGLQNIWEWKPGS